MRYVLLLKTSENILGHAAQSTRCREASLKATHRRSLQSQGAETFEPPPGVAVHCSMNPEATRLHDKFPYQCSLALLVDFALGTKDDHEAPFRPLNDGTHAINVASRRWETAENLRTISTIAKALRLLLHFVGESHQPLHCGPVSL